VARPWLLRAMVTNMGHACTAPRGLIPNLKRMSAPRPIADRRKDCYPVGMPKLAFPAFALAAVLLASCSEGHEVSHPFYVMSPADSDERALFRCSDGPDAGCAIDGLPGPDVFAAGGDAQFIVVGRRRAGHEEYFYFRRVPEETRGWGNNPERIIGPLSRSQFKADAHRLGLPELTHLPR